jgi:hypothetical protein
LKFTFEALTPEFLFEEDRMRKVSAATVATIMGAALYFTLFWGFDALRMLTSPTYGLDDVWRSQFIFGIGSLFGLGPMALIKLAAFFGVLKLAVAGICAVHIVGRLRSLRRGEANSELLEAGLILAALIAIASAGPALLSHNADLVREQAMQIAFAGLAIALCMLERSSRRKGAKSEPVAADAGAAVAQGATWFSPWR